VFVLSAAIPVLALRRPREAGWVLLTLGVLPVALSSLGGNLADGSLVLAVTPALVAGVLFLASAHLDGGGSPARPSRPQDRIGVD
jgi:hypothetical protein